MNVTFYGAVREVTGSMHLLGTETDHILMDCGLFQGRRQEAAGKNRVLPFDPNIVTNMILSHGHIDHSGRIPVLTSRSFNGRIYTTRATRDVCRCLLLDSAHIQESDAEYLNYKTVRSTLSQMKKYQKGNAELRKLLKKNKHHLDSETIHKFINEYRLAGVKPLYTMEEARHALNYLEGIPYREPFEIGNGTTCTFYEAGHILGSAISIIRTQRNGQTTTVCFTGDLGRFDKPIIKDPALSFEEADRNIDLMIMESTYGDRLHDPVGDLKAQLKNELLKAIERKGTILIPAFAYGRTQELLYFLHEIYDEGDIPRLPVYVDSPLSTEITKVFGEHPEVYDEETHHTFLEKGENPFSFDQVHYVQSVEESMALNRDTTPHIVIASSGMCEAGRILHHLRHKIHNSQTSIFIVGFMAEHTLGRRILDLGKAYEESGREGDAPILKILGKEYPLHAHISKLGGFSAHADRDEMLRFLKECNLNIKRIAVVHGEEKQSLAFAGHLTQAGYEAFVPYLGQTVTVN